MRIEVLVEEASAVPVVEAVAAEVVPDAVVEVRFFQGKPDLLKQLPARLRGYASWLRAEPLRVLVMHDEDREDCLALKAHLDDEARRAGLRPKSDGGVSFDVVNRIAVEELEAWLLGDPDAVRAAFPRVSPTFENRARFRKPDEIRGGTAEALQSLLREAGYDDDAARKGGTARAIARHMKVERNSSPSFQCFVLGVRAAAGS